MRWFALLFLLCSSAAVAAPEAPSRGTTRKKPKAPPAPPREASPEPPPAATKPAEELRYSLALAGGAFHGGGFNRGPQGSAQLTLTPPGWGRFSIDVELGWRLARFKSNIPGAGVAVSAMHSVPVLAAGRMNLVRMTHLGVDVRVGVGPLLALHHLSSDFSASSVRSALGWELLAGAQLRFPFGAFEPFLDGRVGFGEAYIPFVSGLSTGVQGLLGVRYQLP
ncbi:hypothetical protein ATI61_105507 [Archangium gephyra]|uniref:Outer membrane protein beta-barrel domain-containing protein n=1 Tax=Archangium gephyra TaxID=48 RepID=A0AAC8THV6_9BACT|nr:hypothetical protein [Archangium gephyra]AKJ06508.1 Hypothetical protein AA314_08134 [Archangium gephyra]REG32179.1 hypothetical protein ATI61_105507 [Archangium gephyra]